MTKARNHAETEDDQIHQLFIGDIATKADFLKVFYTHASDVALINKAMDVQGGSFVDFVRMAIYSYSREVISGYCVRHTDKDAAQLMRD